MLKRLLLISNSRQTLESEAKKSGVKLVHGNVETNTDALRDNGHDLIIMRQLLEHLRDPQLAVRNLARKLAPNGLIIIDTPNRGGLDYTLFRKKYWGGYHVPRHFHLFSQNALVQLIERGRPDRLQEGISTLDGFWIISLRNMKGLNSIAAGNSFWEFLRYKNLPLAASFILFDAVRAKLGFETSNQFIYALKKA
jgi:SAM-dependent methyltransferase